MRTLPTSRLGGTGTKAAAALLAAATLLACAGPGDCREGDDSDYFPLVIDAPCFLFARGPEGPNPYDPGLKSYVCDHMRARDPEALRRFNEMRPAAQREFLPKEMAEADAAFENYERERDAVLGATAPADDDSMQVLHDKKKKVLEAIDTIAKPFGASGYQQDQSPYLIDLRKRRLDLQDRLVSSMEAEEKRVGHAISLKTLDADSHLGVLESNGARLKDAGVEQKQAQLGTMFNGSRGGPTGAGPAGNSAQIGEGRGTAGTMTGGFTSLRAEGSAAVPGLEGGALNGYPEGGSTERGAAIIKTVGGQALHQAGRLWDAVTFQSEIGEEFPKPKTQDEKVLEDMASEHSQRAWNRHEQADRILREAEAKATQAQWHGGSPLWEETKGVAGYAWNHYVGYVQDIESGGASAGLTSAQASRGDRQMQKIVDHAYNKGAVDIGLAVAGGPIAEEVLAGGKAVLAPALENRFVSGAIQEIAESHPVQLAAKALKAGDKVDEALNLNVVTVAKGSKHFEEVSEIFAEEEKPFEFVSKKVVNKAVKKSVRGTADWMESGDSGSQQPPGRLYSFNQGPPP